MYFAMVGTKQSPTSSPSVGSLVNRRLTVLASNLTGHSAEVTTALGNYFPGVDPISIHVCDFIRVVSEKERLSGTSNNLTPQSIGDKNCEDCNTSRALDMISGNRLKFNPTKQCARPFCDTEFDSDLCVHDA